MTLGLFVLLLFPHWHGNRRVGLQNVYKREGGLQKLKLVMIKTTSTNVEGCTDRKQIEKRSKQEKLN